MSRKSLKYFLVLFVVFDVTVCSSQTYDGQSPANERRAPASGDSAKSRKSDDTRANATPTRFASKRTRDRKRDIEFVCELANRLLESGKLLDAESIARKQVESASKEDGSQSDIGELLRILARVKHAQSKLPESIVFMTRAIEMKALKYGDQSIMLIEDLDLLGALQLEDSDYEESELTFKRSLSIKERVLSNTNPIILKTIDDLGRLCFACQRFTEAEAYLQRSLAIRKQFWGENHLETSKGLGRLAALLCAQGKFSEAKPLLQRSVKICEGYRATDGPEYAAALSDLAGVYYCEQDLTKAESVASQAVSLLEKLYGPADSRVQFLKTALTNISQRKDATAMKWRF
jgi:tetratricopeptide (TPR) repeat protein